jgi:hypothetical protein
MRQSTRVIFDRSAFHRDRFDTLVQSPLCQVVKSGKVEVFLTPVFLEETALEYGSPRGSGDWRAHLEFAVEICNGGVFLDIGQIWYNELIAGDGPCARHLLPERKSRHYPSRAEFLERLLEAARTGDIAKAWRESASERSEVEQKKNNQRSLYSNLRSMVSDALQRGTYRRSTFADYLKKEFLRVGRYFMTLVDQRKHDALADQWESAPHQFPFYSAFVRSIMYAIFYAAEEHNHRLDRNSQADYTQLAYLLWADAIVSNDQRFLRSAFDAMWRSAGKRFYTAEEFAKFIRAIA